MQTISQRSQITKTGYNIHLYLNEAVTRLHPKKSRDQHTVLYKRQYYEITCICILKGNALKVPSNEK